MKTLHQFDAAEADRWIIEMRRSLAAHAARLPGSPNLRDIRAAMDTHLLLLREMASVRPERPEEIEVPILQYERAQPRQTGGGPVP